METVGAPTSMDYEVHWMYRDNRDEIHKDEVSATDAQDAIDQIEQENVNTYGTDREIVIVQVIIML